MNNLTIQLHASKLEELYKLYLSGLDVSWVVCNDVLTVKIKENNLTLIKHLL